MGEKAGSALRDHPPDDPEMCNRRAPSGADFRSSAAKTEALRSDSETGAYTIADSGAIIVALIAAGVGSRGQLFDAMFASETIVRRLTTPEHDAARVLAARELSGTFVTVDSVTGSTRMMFRSITATTAVTIVEEARRGLRSWRWRPRVGREAPEIASEPVPGIPHEPMTFAANFQAWDPALGASER